VTWPMKMVWVPLWISVTTAQSNEMSASCRRGVPVGLSIPAGQPESLLVVVGGCGEYCCKFGVGGVEVVHAEVAGGGDCCC